jgi:hypothetical protein
MNKATTLALCIFAQERQLNSENLIEFIQLLSGGKAFETDRRMPFLHNIDDEELKPYRFNRRTKRPSLLWFAELDLSTSERVSSRGNWGLGSISGAEADSFGFESARQFVVEMTSLEFQLKLIDIVVTKLVLWRDINNGDLANAKVKWHRLPSLVIEAHSYKTYRWDNKYYLTTGNRFRPQGRQYHQDSPHAWETRTESYRDFLFATTRRVKSNTEEVEATHERSESVTYGGIQIQVPGTHTFGHIERPRVYSVFGVKLYQGAEDETKHFVLTASSCFSEDVFVEKINDARKKRALIFVHGFNTTFDDACYRFAQIIYDAQFDDVGILFSWPSRGKPNAYLYDRESAELSRLAFSKLITLIHTKTKLLEINIIAHSMGNQVILESLRGLGEKSQTKLVGELIFAAPDVDWDAFK